LTINTATTKQAFSLSLLYFSIWEGNTNTPNQNKEKFSITKAVAAKKIPQLIFL
jgi:hypothetical protein